MKKICILVPAGEANNLSSIVGAYKLFMRANAYWAQRGPEVQYEICLAGTSSKVEFYEGLFTVNPDSHISEIQNSSLIIIPSLNHNYNRALKQNRLLKDWLTEQYKNGAEIASICTGAFLLADTGLLDGKSCSTHWSAAEDFRKLFPKVKLQTDNLITDENGIYTNGGAYSFLNLLIYLVEKYWDRQTAIYCSKVFQIEIDRNTQSEFAIFTGQKQHNDEVVARAQAYIESHVHEKISIDELTDQLSVGRRNFDRRFIKATGNTPVEYAQRVKIEAAKKAYETTRKSVSEVMYEVGYNDQKAFRELFRRITGLSPMEYQNKYNRDSIVKG